MYLETVGGVAQILNQKIEKIAGVHFRREFGNTEAMWELDVIELPAIVSIDARGKSLHRKIEISSRRVLGKMLRNGPAFRG